MTAVTIIVPCRNEKGHIRAFLDSLLAQQLPPGVESEILIADGMSDDGTREILAGYAARFPQIGILDNPQRHVSTGLNQCIRRARGAVIVRMDVHSEYATDYVAQSLRALEETGAWNVGGPALTRPQGYMQTAISLAYASRFGCGGALFHNADYEGWVDTVTYGCWRKQTLERLGLFDEELIRNQDDELNLRIHRAGGKVWQTPKIRSWYKPRSSLAALFKQYYQYGYWKVRVLRKHKIPASIRHLIPGAFVAALAVLALLAPFFKPARLLLSLTIGAYLLAALLASVALCARPGRWRYLPVLPVVFGAYHISYGAGFLRGLFDLAAGRAPSGSYSTLSR